MFPMRLPLHVRGGDRPIRVEVTVSNGPVLAWRAVRAADVAIEGAPYGRRGCPASCGRGHT